MCLPGVAFLRIMRFSPLSMYVSHPSSSALSFKKAVTLLLFTVSPLLLEPRGIWVRASMYFHTALGSGSSFRSFWQCLRVRKEERTQTQKEPRAYRTKQQRYKRKMRFRSGFSSLATFGSGEYPPISVVFGVAPDCIGGCCCHGQRKLQYLSGPRGVVRVGLPNGAQF